MRSDLIMEMFERADRAAKIAAEGGPNSGAHEQRCVEALKQLCEIRFPLRILSTNMGCRLSRMDAHPSSQIRDYSAQVIKALLRRGYEDSFHRRNHLNQLNAASLKIKKTPAVAAAANNKRKPSQKKLAENTPWLMSSPKPSQQTKVVINASKRRLVPSSVCRAANYQPQKHASSLVELF